MVLSINNHFHSSDLLCYVLGIIWKFVIIAFHIYYKWYKISFLNKAGIIVFHFFEEFFGSRVWRSYLKCFLMTISWWFLFNNFFIFFLQIFRKLILDLNSLQNNTQIQKIICSNRSSVEGDIIDLKSTMLQKIFWWQLSSNFLRFLCIILENGLYIFDPLKKSPNFKK